MRLFGLITSLIVLLNSATFAQTTGQQEVDPLADYIMQQMASKLAAAKHVSFHLETSTDVVDDDLRVRMGRTADVALRRPDRLMMHARGDGGRQGFRLAG